MSSSRIGSDLDIPALPTRIESTIFGLTRFACWRGVMSIRSFGVKDRAQSMMTISSGLRVSGNHRHGRPAHVFGKVRTKSIRGAFVPTETVSHVRRLDARNRRTREGGHPDALQERRCAARQSRIHTRNDSLTEYWLISAISSYPFPQTADLHQPEPVQEPIDPVCTLCFRHQSRFDQLSLNIVPRPLSRPADGQGVVGRAESEDDEYPGEAESD
jgi:hypothetical protein